MGCLQGGGTSYQVPCGRRDSRVSKASNVNLPGPTESVATATSQFAAKGLTQNEMVTLLGKHLTHSPSKLKHPVLHARRILTWLYENISNYYSHRGVTVNAIMRTSSSNQYGVEILFQKIFYSIQVKSTSTFEYFSLNLHAH